jgi:hypothetical protein
VSQLSYAAHRVAIYRRTMQTACVSSAIAAQRFESQAEISGRRTPIASQHVALLKQCHDLCAQTFESASLRTEHEVRQARFQGQRHHLTTVCRDATFRVKGTQLRQ